MAVLNQERITSHLYSERGEDEPLTSLVMDQESFDHIWDMVEELDLKKMEGGRPHPELMAYARRMGRLPIIVKTDRTKTIFEELGSKLVMTSKFTGIVRGASKNKLVLKEEWLQRE